MLIEPACGIDAPSDVAPLVGAADLQHHAVALVQFGKIVALQQGIGKFGKRNAHIIALDALLHRFFRQHCIHGKMLADVAQKIQAAHAAEPIVIIGHNRGIIALEAQKRRQLAANAVHPLLHGFQSIQAALGRLEARVANHAGGTAHQRHRRVAGQLEAAQGQHRQQMADVQAVGRGVEAAVKRDFLLVEQGIKRFGIGGLRDQAARLEVLDNAHCFWSFQ